MTQNMTIRHLTALMAGIVLTASLGARAATVTLVPSPGNVIQNGTFTVDLMLNAADAPGNHPGSFVGKVTVDFDPTRIAYQSFAYSVPASQFSVAPTTGTVGGRQTVSLGFMNATDVGKIGVFTFSAPGGLGTTSLGIADYNKFLKNSFVSKNPTDQIFYPAFNGTSVTVSAVPLPATAWLLVTGFGLIGLRQKLGRRTQSPTP